MNATASWHLVSTRPAALNAALSRAVREAGGALIPLEPIEIAPRREDATVTRLLDALRRPLVVFTSPSAVDVAADWLDLGGALNRRTVIATGAGTQKALANRGVRQARAPSRMDSEGVLAMTELQSINGMSLGLVTGAGGRGLLAPSLEARGADVLRVDLYDRVQRVVPRGDWQALRDLTGPIVLAVTSSEAFDALFDQWPEDLDATAWGYVAASPRLATHIESRLGTVPTVSEPPRWVTAASPMPEDLVRAAAALRRA